VAGSVAPATGPSTDPVATFGTATATCDAGQLAVGGGVKVDDQENTGTSDTCPDAGGRAWTARVDNNDVAAAHAFTVYAICLPAAAAG